MERPYKPMMTLGDLDDDNYNNPHQPAGDDFFIQTQLFSFENGSLRDRLQYYQILAKNYIKQLHLTSPSLSVTAWSCLTVYVLWQYCRLFSSNNKMILSILQDQFVCSRRNLLKGRWPSLLLSAVSHSGFLHLLFNLVALLSLGPKVQHILLRNRNSISTLHWPLWPLLMGAAVSGSMAYIVLDFRKNAGGGCMGLSGVTLSLLAVYARFFPHATMGIMLAGVIPIRMTSDKLLKVMVLWSVVGTLIMPANRSNVAHSAHLGGLLFGIFYHDCLWKRRLQLQSMSKKVLGKRRWKNHQRRK